MSGKLRLYDNTRISDYRRCPRYFYYRHIRGWAPAGSPRAALVFGGAWHAAMDSLWSNISKGIKDKDQLVEDAYGAFVQHWTEEGLPDPRNLSYEEQKGMLPRTPMVGMEMILSYLEKRVNLISTCEVMDIERPFIVPLTPDDPTLFYVGRIDKVMRYQGRIYGIEHKTTTAYKVDGHFRSTFLESFSPNSQVDGYLYTLHMSFPDDKIGGVWVDAALVHKEDHEGFQFIPIDRQMPMLDSWLYDVNDWIERIEADKAKLERVKGSDPYMAAFPKNTNSCFDFNQSCIYLYLCKAKPNPHGESVPPGFEESPWDPLEHLGINWEDLELDDG